MRDFPLITDDAPAAPTPLVLLSSLVACIACGDLALAQRKLNGEFAGDTSVCRLMIDPVGRRVTFLADPADDEVYELFSVPIDGSAPAVRLNGEGSRRQWRHPGAQPGRDAGRLPGRPGGRRAGTSCTPCRSTLDGSNAPVKLNGALPQGGYDLIDGAPAGVREAALPRGD